MSCFKANNSVTTLPKLIPTLEVGTVADANDKNRLNTRAKMEDELVELVNYKEDYSFFAVYDGHGGSQVASYCKDNLHNTFFDKLHDDSYLDEAEIARVWEDTYNSVDAELTRALAEGDADCAGCTATTAFITPKSQDEWLLSVANVGDSKALLFSEGKSRFITDTHRATTDTEVRRVKEAGGWIAGEKSKRLNGRLSVTRALGDHYIKKTTKGLICTPAVSTHSVTFPSVCILATDGVWDFVEEEVQRLLHTEDVFESTAQKLAQTILDISLKKHSNDNIAVVVIMFVKKTPDSFLSRSISSALRMTASV